MKVKYKFWFENERGYVFGKGSYELLKKVHELGSIRKASIEMGLSYRHAWGMIQEIEKNLGIKVAKSERGGKRGGNTTLTEEGLKLINDYEKYAQVFDYIIYHPYIKPSITVDAILVENSKILLIRRKRNPYRGKYALPGGFVEYGEKTENAVVREVKEETGLKVVVRSLVGVYSDPKRDPRDHTITVVYEVQRIGGELKGGDDAAEAQFMPLSKLPPLAFDHSKIVKEYLSLHRV